MILLWTLTSQIQGRNYTLEIDVSLGKNLNSKFDWKLVISNKERPKILNLDFTIANFETLINPTQSASVAEITEAMRNMQKRKIQFYR